MVGSFSAVGLQHYWYCCDDYCRCCCWIDSPPMNDDCRRERCSSSLSRYYRETANLLQNDLLRSLKDAKISFFARSLKVGDVITSTFKGAHWFASLSLKSSSNYACSGPRWQDDIVLSSAISNQKQRDRRWQKMHHSIYQRELFVES